MKSVLKALMVSVLSLSALVGCGEDDGGKLAGTYNKVIHDGESSYPTKIILEYKKPDYQISLIIGNGSPRNLAVVKKDGNYLVKSDNSHSKMFEIKNNGAELISLYTSSPTNYLKKSN